MLYVGLISGTSVDGIDAALTSIPEDGPFEILACHHQRYPEAIRDGVLGLTRPGDNEIERMGELDAHLGEEFARACLTLLAQAGIAANEVTAIGSHGQTIRHHKGGSVYYTVQIGSPAIIADRTGIRTVADFRASDIAAGGHGAPLVPAFHQYLFRSETANRAVINVGGIANITTLPRDAAAPVVGFDTGPGNTLLDRWIEHHRQQAFDDDGTWARSGHVVTELLSHMLSDPYFDQPAPKSIGQERFNFDWLVEKVASLGSTPRAEDVQATLVELTALSIARALDQYFPVADEVFVCGGGARNGLLMDRLQDALGRVRAQTTASLGLDPDWVEAAAFAWLASRRLAGRTGNLPSVTGARRAAILGGVYAPPPGK